MKTAEEAVAAADVFLQGLTAEENWGLVLAELTGSTARWGIDFLPEKNIHLKLWSNQVFFSIYWNESTTFKLKKHHCMIC